MAKKRKATPKRKAKAPRKAAAKAARKSASSKVSGKLSPEDTLTALMVAVAIIIVLAGLYLYQQNSKPKTTQLPPSITFIAPV